MSEYRNPTDGPADQGDDPVPVADAASAGTTPGLPHPAAPPVPADPYATAPVPPGGAGAPPPPARTRAPPAAPVRTKGGNGTLVGVASLVAAVALLTGAAIGHASWPSDTATSAVTA